MNIFRAFGFSRAEAPPDSEWNPLQVQTMADAATCEEARRVCKKLSNSHLYNTPDYVALRQTVGNDQASYLFGRFGQQFGWTKLQQAQKFYDDNKGSKGGWR